MLISLSLGDSQTPHYWGNTLGGALALYGALSWALTLSFLTFKMS